MSVSVSVSVCMSVSVSVCVCVCVCVCVSFSQALILIEYVLRNGSDRFINDAKRRARDIAQLKKYKHYDANNQDDAKEGTHAEKGGRAAVARDAQLGCRGFVVVRAQIGLLHVRAACSSPCVAFVQLVPKPRLYMTC